MKCPECGKWSLFDFIVVCKKCSFDLTPSIIEKYRLKANKEQTKKNRPKKAWNTLEELLSRFETKEIKKSIHGHHIFTMLGQLSIRLKKGEVKDVINIFETSYKLNPEESVAIVYLDHIYTLLRRKV